jgi:tetratricopeptide (TPR) repeat protein
VTGTAGYLAPEVLRGRPPSPRSDLYAFAVVVRGLLEGTTAPLTPRALAVFERALSAEWATRYESPVRFIDDLAAAQRPQPLEPPRRWTRRHTLAAAAVVAIVASAAAALWSSRQATTSIAPASEVLLTDLVNGTADPELDGAGEVMRSQLAQSPHFELLPRDRVRASLARMGRGDGGTSAPEVAREIALREGVPLVVFTALTRLGADYTLSVKLEQVGARPTFARRTWTRSFAAPTRAALFEAMHLAAVWIRQMAGELPADLDQQDRAASDTTTSSWEALRLFAQAADLQAAGRVHDATLVLEQAVRIDPDFAMAHTRLGDYLIGLRRDQEGFAAWQQALAAAERRQLTSRETLRLRAQYLDDTGDLAGAEKAFRTYAVHYPNDFHAAFFVGASLKEVNRLAEAVPWLERALTLRPQSAVGAVHLAVAYLDLERGADAARAIDHVESLGASEWSTWLRALSLFAAVKPVDALAALEPLAASADPQWRSRAHVIRASWLSEVGQDEEALTELRAGIAHDTAHGLRDRLADKWLHFAELQGRVQDPGASSSVHLALETASNARRLQRAVGILARAGHRADAERLMARFDALPPIPLAAAARDRAQGELALGGDVRGAVTAFERALANTRRWENLLPFAEALAKAGDLARAESVLRITADHPAMIYAGSEPQSPGLWRQSLARLADLVERRDPSAAAGIRQRFAKIILQPVPSATR